MQRLVFVTVVVVALFMPANARGALFFLLDRPAAEPNARVTVRTGGTPKGFELRQRVKPFQRPVRIYLVAADAAAEVHSRLDPRLHFVGSVAPDRNGRGLLTFGVPPLDAQTYTLAYWCPGCASHSRGRTFFVQRPGQFAPRYRSQTLLRVEATDGCPVTLPNGSRPPGILAAGPWHGNGVMWARLSPGGTYAVSPDDVGADGSISNKVAWVTTPRAREPVVVGERLDAPSPPLRVLGVNGDVSPFMTPIVFAAAGCWRVRARADDVSLTYVVDVRIEG
jgi:hypothetical protein